MTLISKLGWFFPLCILLTGAQPANANSENWILDTSEAAGPVIVVHVASSGNVNMGVMISFEYERKCDPLFNYLEFSPATRAQIGIPVKKYRIDNSNIGVIHNGSFYTWYAGKVQYPYGFEVGFGITRELWNALNSQTNSLIYVREDGVQFQLPTHGLKEKLSQALNYCKSQI